MKKIAYVITQAEMGGAQKNVFLLCKYLKDDYDITVYSAPNGKLIDNLKDIKVKHVAVPYMVREINFSKDFKTYKFLVKEFIKNRYDIVHCHSSKAGILAREAANKAGIKNIIYTAHGFVFNEPMSTLKKNLYISLEKYEAKKTNTLICVNSKELKLAEELNIKPKNNIVYIPNGIEFNEVNITSQKQNDGTFVFGLVANFYETKGHRYLIEAFNRLTKKFDINVKLVLVGSGALEYEMKSLAAGNNNIIFAGYGNGEEFIKTFDCFVMSSVKEGFPFVILEAIKNKVPIISTDVGAVREILDNGNLGYIVEPSSIDGLADAMLHVINNKAEATFKAQNAFDKSKNMYSAKNMIELTKELY